MSSGAGEGRALGGWRGRRERSRAQQGWGGEGEGALAGEGQEEVFLVESELLALNKRVLMVRWSLSGVQGK